MIIKFTVAFIMVVVDFYIWNTWRDEKVKIMSLKSIASIIITTLFTLINYYNVNQFVKIINMTLILIIFYKFLFNVKLRESLSGPLITQTIFFVSELFFAILLVIILRENANQLTNNYFGTAIANIGITIIAFCISKIPFIRIIYSKLNRYISNFDEVSVIFITCILIFIYTIFALNTYYKLNSTLLFILSVTIAILSFALVFMFFKTKDDYYRINDKYNGSLVSLKELEKVLSNQRIDNHENRNHLMTIRNMTTNKKIIKFIDSILNNKINDNSDILHETTIIPEGGLRGLIYSKLLLMSEKDIEYELDISNSIRTLDMLEFGDDTLLDICKIIGIFLDNAIEEVETIDDKYIIIEMYIDDNVLNVVITNTFDNTKDKKDIFKPGVSSKGGNHGYGLSLVKKLVKYNRKLKTYNEISETEFIQILKVYK